MKKNIMTGIFLSLFFFAIGPFSFSQQQSPVATITFLEGVGDVVRNNQEPTPLKENDPLFIGDRIRTKSYSKAHITFADKSVLKLAPGSCVAIEEFKLSEDSKREFARVKLTRGKLEAIIAKTGKPETFVIDTPNAKGSVKGSDIFISYMGGKTAAFVKEGSLSLLNPSLPDKQATLTSGTCSFVPFNEAVQPARRILDTELLIHKRDVERSLIKKWIPSKGSSVMNAVIVELTGTVRIYKKGSSDWKAAAKDDVFAEGDTLQTASDGEATVRLSNGNSLIVASNTELSAATLRHDAKTGNYENTFAMKRGRVGAVVEKISKESTFQLKTSTVICGVRGTLLEVIVPEDPAQPTQAFFEGGEGFVRSLTNQQTLNVAPGENVTIDAAGAIGRPVVTTPEQRDGMIITQQEVLWAVDNLARPISQDQAMQNDGSILGLTRTSTAETDVASLGAAAQNLEIISTLFSNQSSSTNIFYSVALTAFDQGGPVDVCPASIDINLYNDHTWTATINAGHISANGIGGMFECRNGADILRVGNADFLLSQAWYGQVTINSVIAGKTITGTAGGADPGTAPINFSGSASGTWN